MPQKTSHGDNIAVQDDNTPILYNYNRKENESLISISQRDLYFV